MATTTIHCQTQSIESQSPTEATAAKTRGAEQPKSPAERRVSSETSSEQRSISCTSRSGTASDCEIDDLLAKCSSWNFPIFELRDATHEVLSKLAYRLFDLSELFTHFRLPRDKFLSYFRALENGYRSCAYHNSVHAADVLQSVWYLINLQPSSQNKPLSKRLQHYEVLSLLLAAAIHDFDHPGFTNNFLVTTGHQLAILYNDRSVLENHHVASAWKLMISDGKHDFLAGQDDALVNKIRIATIKLVLSTDLAKHTKIIARWRGLFEKGNAFDLKDDNSRLIMMQMIIKCSDIANPAKEYSAHSKWSKLVIEEFYLQGDLERNRGLPISKFMDRNDPDIVGLQTSFIRTVVKPCFEALSESSFIINHNSILRRQLDENLLIWEKTKVNEKGELITPDIEQVKKHAEVATERENVTETDILIEEASQSVERAEIEEGDWMSDTDTGLIRACCAPLLHLFRSKRSNRAYHHS